MEREKYLKLIGNRIKEIRSNKNITQQELASICNYEKSNMSRIEAGKSNITIGTILKICKALDVSLSDFFDCADFK